MDYFRNNISPSSKKNPEFDKIKQYQKEIGKFNILSAEEEIDIIKQAQQGDQQARNRIIEANLGFVISVAKTYQNQGLRLRELISIGNVGLINAIKGFDDTKELKFISYAVRWIRQYILKVLDRDNHHIHIPQNYTIQSYKKVWGRFYANTGTGAY